MTEEEVKELIELFKDIVEEKLGHMTENPKMAYQLSIQLERDCHILKNMFYDMSSLSKVVSEEQEKLKEQRIKLDSDIKKMFKEARNEMDGDIRVLQVELQGVKEQLKEQLQRRFSLRSAIIGAIIGGAVGAIITYLLTKLL